MEAKLFRPRTETFMLNGSEELQVFITDTGVGIEEYKVYSEAFETWITQDIDLLFNQYPTQYQELCDRVYAAYVKKGGW